MIRPLGASKLHSPLAILLSLLAGASLTTTTANDIACGQRPIVTSGTIAHGQPSWPGQFPWHTAIYRSEQLLTISYACGGFVVGDRAIITAAHCVTAPSGYQLAADELTVRLGLHDLLVLARHSQEHRVRRVHRHGNFSAGSPRHDVALLTLRTNVEFGPFVQPICLPGAGPGQEAFSTLRFGTVTGWGWTEDNTPARTLRSASVPLVSHIRCLETDPTLFGPLLHEGMFCAGWENGTNVCNGDSGGALVANVNGSWTAFGVVSFTGLLEPSDDSPLRCNTKSLAGFTNLLQYQDWIESIARSEAVTLSVSVAIQHQPPIETPGRISESMCRRYRVNCLGKDLSYLATVVHPVQPPHTLLVIDCFAVLISDRFLLAPASCRKGPLGAAPTGQFIILEVAGQAMDCRIKTFHQHPNFVNNNPPTEPQDQSNLALIELERKVPLSTCQFVCLWTGGGESDTLPAITLYSAVNGTTGDKSIRPSEGRCYDELLGPMVMLGEPEGARVDRLVGIVLWRSCTKIRFIRLDPFVGWIESVVWHNQNGPTSE
ncbi:polyserase-2-like [Anopheles nili]|uniref:polyserase-2-like n=1 Tax=Anopheles nili TaxID=185578 RepID=UPI00237B7172|nr:polyserase-2-like [Anopheles nili]